MRVKGELPFEGIEDTRLAERARVRLGDAELDEEPAQACQVGASIGDEILPMVDEQSQVALGTLQPNR